eukprot:EG_transcript_11466
MPSEKKAPKRSRSPAVDADKAPKKTKYIIAPHAPECHKIAIRKRLRKRKALKNRLIPSEWTDRHTKLLGDLIAALRTAAEDEAPLPAGALKALGEVHRALEWSKPADLPAIGEKLQATLELLGHPLWVRAPKVVPPVQAQAMLKLYTGLCRAQALLEEDFRTQRMRPISLQLHAIQLHNQDKYEVSLLTLASLVQGWDRKGQHVSLDPDLLLRICESTAQPSFSKGVSRSHPELAAARDFLQSVLRCRVGTGLPPKHQQQIRQWITTIEADMAKFGDAVKKRRKLKGAVLYRLRKVPMKPIKPGRTRTKRRVTVGKKKVKVRTARKKEAKKGAASRKASKDKVPSAPAGGATPTAAKAPKAGKPPKAKKGKPASPAAMEA